MALFLGGNFARDAIVIHGGHIDQEAPRQGDVAGDARPFFADGFLGNLHQDLLTFFQQVANLRHGATLKFSALRAAHIPASPAAAAIAVAVECHSLLMS